MAYDPNQQQPGPAYGYPNPQQPQPAWAAATGKFQSMSTGQKVGIGCGGAFGLFVFLGLIGAAVGPDTKEIQVPGPTVTVTVTQTVPGPTVTVPAAAPAASEAPKPSDTPAPAQPTREATGTLPNFVGKQLQASQDGAQAAGFYLLSSTDATGAGRMQVLDRNWKVCAQTPAPGTHPLTTQVTFDTVKTEESCP